MRTTSGRPCVVDRRAPTVTSSCPSPWSPEHLTSPMATEEQRAARSSPLDVSASGRPEPPVGRRPERMPDRCLHPTHDATRPPLVAPAPENGSAAARSVPSTETSLVQSDAIVVQERNRVGLAARDSFACPMVQSGAAPLPGMYENRTRTPPVSTRTCGDEHLVLQLRTAAPVLGRRNERSASDEDQGNLNSRSIIRWSAELPPTLGRSGTRACSPRHHRPVPRRACVRREPVSRRTVRQYRTRATVPRTAHRVRIGRSRCRFRSAAVRADTGPHSS